MMGYLAILTGMFVGGLVINAMALALLSRWMYGSVQEWVLAAAIFVAGLGAALAAEHYEKWSQCRVTR
jgi:hypothetical protein